MISRRMNSYEHCQHHNIGGHEDSRDPLRQPVPQSVVRPCNNAAGLSYHNAAPVNKVNSILIASTHLLVARA